MGLGRAVKSVSLRLKVGVISRSKGRTALNRCAYQLGGNAKIKTKTAKVRTLPDGHHFDTLIFLPEGAPEWARDPETLWIEAARVERQKNAQEARYLDIQIPRDIPVDCYRDLAAAVFQPFARDGLPVQVDIHIEVATDGKPNPNFHSLIAMRGFVDGEFSATKTKYRRWNGYFLADAGRGIRAVVAKRMTEFCSQRGIKIEIDPRSNSDRGLPDPEPQYPRPVFRRPEMPWSKEILEGLAERRKIRHEFDECELTKSSATEEVAIAEQEMLNYREKCVRVEAEITRFVGQDFVNTCNDWREWEKMTGASQINLREVAPKSILIEIDTTEVVVHESMMVIEGPITESVVDILASLASDLKWRQISVEGPASPSERKALCRALRSYSRTEPALYQLARLEATEVFQELEGGEDSDLDRRLSVMEISSSTRDAVVKAISGKYDFPTVELADTPALAYAALELSCFTLLAGARLEQNGSPLSGNHNPGFRRN